MIKDALEAVQKRMADAMAKAGRTDRVTLIAVTKIILYQQWKRWRN